MPQQTLCCSRQWITLDWIHRVGPLPHVDDSSVGTCFNLVVNNYYLVDEHSSLSRGHHYLVPSARMTAMRHPDKIMSR
jgi:hypothetical protein